MGAATEIGWCDSTVNPTSGCDGCELWNARTGARFCYAGTLHEGRLAKSLPALYAPSFDEVRLIPGRTAKAAAWPDLAGKCRPDKPWFDGMPRVIFVGDMGDVFSKAVPFDYLKSELVDVATGAKGSRHVWMVLTKQASRAVEFALWLYEECGIAWPANIWPGVSVTSEKTAGRAEILARHPAPTKFISAEPLLGPVAFDGGLLLSYRLVIVGGESGPRARPMHPRWARSVRDQCVAAGVAFHFKQWGEYSPQHPPAPLPGGREVPRALVGDPDSDEMIVYRVGKKAAGRTLDGRTWDQFPGPGPREV